MQVFIGEVTVDGCSAEEVVFQLPSLGSGTVIGSVEVRIDTNPNLPPVMVVRLESGSEEGLRVAREKILAALSVDSLNAFDLGDPKASIVAAMKVAERQAIGELFNSLGGTDSPAYPLQGMPEFQQTPSDWWFFMDEDGVIPMYPVVPKSKVPVGSLCQTGR